MTLELLGNYVFQFFIVAAIGFVGAFCNDFWAYKKYNQKFSIIEDLIGGVFTSFSMNFLKLIYINWRDVEEGKFNYGIFLCIVFFYGVFSIEILGFVLHPGFIIKVIKGVLKHSGKGILEGVGEAIDEQETEIKAKKEKKETEKKDEKEEEKEPEEDEKRKPARGEKRREDKKKALKENSNEKDDSGTRNDNESSESEDTTYDDVQEIMDFINSLDSGSN